MLVVKHNVIVAGMLGFLDSVVVAAVLAAASGAVVGMFAAVSVAVVGMFAAVCIVAQVPAIVVVAQVSLPRRALKTGLEVSAGSSPCPFWSPNH